MDGELALMLYCNILLALNENGYAVLYYFLLCTASLRYVVCVCV